MKKSKAIRLAGFAGALCASGALIATAVSGTGAYFTDAKNGSVNASLGHVRLNTTDLTLNYTNLLPGQSVDKQVTFTADGTGAEDVWLVLPAGSPITGTDSATALGRYGHFAVSSPAGSFTSYNLRTNPGSDHTQDCGIDGNGHGGSNQQASSTNNADPNSYVPYCGAPQAILLASNLNAGQGGNATITFGYTKLLKSGQDAPLANVTPFKIVATQAGVRPDDVNNPSS